MVKFLALVLAVAGGGCINAGFIYHQPLWGLAAGVCFYFAIRMSL